MTRRLAARLSAAVSLACAAPAWAGTTVLEARPSALDAGVKAFDEPNLVLVPSQSTAATPLVLFLTGTGGKPRGGLDLLQVVAGQGYRAVSLAYDDMPAVSQVCPQDPDPGCSEAFRRMRVDGVGPSAAVSNPPAEAVTARLTALLHGLADTRPAAEGWHGYLKDDAPDWSRIVVSGLSQGAGMAAYIAKHHAVARVVLFSSPWDWTGGRARTPAPWLSQPSATPPERWWAEYHRREATAAELQHAYAALRIPADHVRVFDRDVPPQFARAADGPNPFHALTIRDPRYADDWRALFGTP